jgi:hypothetical protein
MRRFTRVVLAIAALTVGAGSVQLRAQSQDPEPVPAVTPEPVEQVIVAPADEPAATVTQEEAPVGAPVAEEAAPAAPAVVESAPLDPPPPSAPAVDTSASYWAPTPVEEPARERKPSDWIFLGIVALAAVVIVARLTREHRESVSIHEDRFPPASSGPPIVRHS